MASNERSRHSTTTARLNVYIQGQGFPILGLHGHPGTGLLVFLSSPIIYQNAIKLLPLIYADKWTKSRWNGNFDMTDHLN